MKKHHSELKAFAYIPNYHQNIQFLAEDLADTDEWDFSDASTKTFPILKNYLEFTFRKIRQEGKLIFSTNNKFACFNTGLITHNLEDIFAFFEAYKNPTTKDSAPYYFKAFLKKSDHAILKHFLHDLPDVANFFEKPDLLIFNPKYELIPDIDHIIEDNIDRFPVHLHQADGAELRRQITGAIEEVKKKVRTNYKLAVPQYYDGKIQLLLPLCLTSGSSHPDLALVVHRLNEQAYTARTCLTLKMAYNNARLIVKPQSNWLRP